jgi:electron transfer flavoprotein alpha/beta subunit
MNIVVLLQAVRDPASFTVNRKAQKLFVNREAFIINPSDLNALEAALTLAYVGGTVTALAWGGAPAEDALYQARAMGASRALLVRDAALPDADAGAVTRVVQGALEHLGGADLILLGADVLHADLAQVGPRLAAHLGCAFVPGAVALESADGAVRAVVRDGAGYRRLESGLPAVVSVQRNANQPRYAPAGSIIRVYAEPGAVEAVALADLNLDPETLAPQASVRGESFPPERTLGERAEGSADEIVRRIAVLIAAEP